MSVVRQSIEFLLLAGAFYFVLIAVESLNVVKRQLADLDLKIDQIQRRLEE